MDLQVTLFLLILLPLSFFATLGFCCVEIRSFWRQYRLSIQTQRHVFASQNRLIFLSEDHPVPWNLDILELIMNKEECQQLHIPLYCSYPQSLVCSTTMKGPAYWAQYIF